VLAEVDDDDPYDHGPHPQDGAHLAALPPGGRGGDDGEAGMQRGKRRIQVVVVM
jgi:hypothetical protein